MKVYAALDPRLPLSAVAGYAQRVELIGFDGLHVAETLHDSLAVALMALTEHTTRLTVRTAVTLAFVRSPTLVAYTAWDLAALSGGRFELGLGTQIRQNIEGPVRDALERATFPDAGLPRRAGSTVRGVSHRRSVGLPQPRLPADPHAAVLQSRTRRCRRSADLARRGECRHVRVGGRADPRCRHALDQFRSRVAGVVRPAPRSRGGVGQTRRGADDHRLGRDRHRRRRPRRRRRPGTPARHAGLPVLDTGVCAGPGTARGLAELADRLRAVVRNSGGTICPPC